MHAIFQLLSFLAILLPWNAQQAADLYLNLDYKAPKLQRLRMDLYVPHEGDGPFPAVIVVHGGMWFAGGNRDYPDFGYHFAKEGIVFAPVTYTRNPENGFTGQVQDVKDAIRWLRAHAGEFNIDPDRIGLFGSSAGGHLAGLAGLSGDGEGFGDDPPGTSSEVRALFLLYGVYDITDWEHNPITRWYAGGFRPSEAQAVYKHYSHVPHVDGSEPPVHIMHGTKDRVSNWEDAEALHQALTDAGVASSLELVPGQPHGFCKSKPWLRPMACEAMLRFFKETL